MKLQDFSSSLHSIISLSKDLNESYGQLTKKEFDQISDTDYSKLFFEKTWVSGGQTGGNCWAEGSQEYNSVSCEEPGSLNEELLSIIKEFCPDMSAIFFFDNIIPLVKYYNFTKSEYYGNFYEYTRMYIIVEELFNVIESYKE